MNKNIKKNFFLRIKTSAIIGLIGTIAYIGPPIIFSFICICIGLYILCFEWPKLCAKQTYKWALTPLYPVLPFVLLIIINHSTEGKLWLLMLFSTVWAFDTGGYLIGKCFGKTLISPTISPGKTWEGAFGGYIVAFFVYVTIDFWCFYPLKDISNSLLVLLFCICSFFGDFFESWLKRASGIKDSGLLLPGHGGLLDRFDGILFATYFLYFLKKIT